MRFLALGFLVLMLAIGGCATAQEETAQQEEPTEEITTVAEETTAAPEETTMKTVVVVYDKEQAASSSVEQPAPPNPAAQQPAPERSASEKEEGESASEKEEGESASEKPAPENAPLTIAKQGCRFFTQSEWVNATPEERDFIRQCDQAIISAKDTGGLSNDKYYKNAAGIDVHSPAYSTDGSVPAEATAQCVDGTYSFSLNRSGTCSSHGGVSQWLR